MKKTKILTSTLALAFLLLFATVGPAFAGWHDLTQAERNQLIVDEANSWSDGSDGGQCKVWVQNMIHDVSDVLVPSNASYCSWGNNNDSEYVVGRSAYISGVVPGEIIQMELSSAYGGGPHTLVVTSNNGYQITVKESNWCEDDCELVGSRDGEPVSYSKFYNMVNCYSVYYIQ